VRSAVVIGGYPWTDLAPEAVGLAFGAFALADGDFTDSVLTAVNMGRDADTTAALAGALAGALGGQAAIPGQWARVIKPVRGSCLPAMAGYHVRDIADLLVPDGDDGSNTVRAQAGPGGPAGLPAAVHPPTPEPHGPHTSGAGVAPALGAGHEGQVAS
jgi:hypothetical protein